MSNVIALATGGKVVGIVPQSIEEVFRLASAVAKSGLAPRGMETAEKLTVAIMHGMEIGLPPMQAIQRIAVVNGRPTLWGDAVPALVLSKGFRLKEWMEGDGDARRAWCEVTRPDGASDKRSFAVADARKAGLWGKAGPWQQYPDRMLQMRARGFACRDIAGDVLAGLYIAEELDESEMKDITPRKSSAESKRDGTTETFNAIRGEIAECISLEMLDHVIENHRDDLDTMPRKWAQMVQDDYEVKAAEFKKAVVA